MSTLSQFAGGKSQKFQEFLTSGTFTPSAKLLAAGGTIEFELYGGGGGGGGISNTVAEQASGGGGGGGYLKGYATVLSPVSVTIGAGGSGGVAGANGATGGSSAIGSIVVIGGGGGAGANSAVSPIPAGGANPGGGATITPYRCAGSGSGATSIGENLQSPSQTFAGSGINGRCGGGGGGCNVAPSGTGLSKGLGASGGADGSFLVTGVSAAANSGGGGGGVGDNGTNNRTGGNGGSGYCLISWWE